MFNNKIMVKWPYIWYINNNGSLFQVEEQVTEVEVGLTIAYVDQDGLRFVTLISGGITGSSITPS